MTFEITCPLTGAHIVVSTGELGRDSSGYAVQRSMGSCGAAWTNAGTLQLRLELGARAIALTEVAENCTAENPSRQVTIVAGQATAVAFAVTCTAATGVIEVVIAASPSGIVGPFKVMVDGHSHDAYSLSPTYVSVPAGPHAVSLEPSGDCTVDDHPER